MAVVIAILLGLILVALMSSNKEAATGVGRFVRIAFILTIIGAAWLVLIGYSIWFYFQYSEMNWYDLFGVFCMPIIPAVVLFLNRSSVREFFEKDNKTVFKRLFQILVGVIAYVTAAIAMQEFKKEIDGLFWYIAFIGVISSGLYIKGQAAKLQITLLQAFAPSDYRDEVADKEFLEFEIKRDNEWFHLYENGFNELPIDEQEAILEKRRVEMDAALQRKFALYERLKKQPKLSPYILGIFWFCILFFCFKIISFIWDTIFDIVIQLDFLHGKAWMANALIIVILIFLAGAILQYFEGKKIHKPH